MTKKEKQQTLTYVKGLPTPLDELNAIGMTTFEMFLNEYSNIFHRAACETVNHLLVTDKFNKSGWNTHLQKTYGINKRHANGVISSAQGRVKSAKEQRKLHLQVLKRKIKSTKTWIKTTEKKLKSCRKFYAKTNWIKSKTSCLLPLSCSLKFKSTNKENLEFQIHHKRRKLFLLENKVKFLETADIKANTVIGHGGRGVQAREGTSRDSPLETPPSLTVKVPLNDCFIVGSKTETWGNQVCQWDGENLKFRVPYCLESKFGNSVTTRLGNFKRNINRIPQDGSKTWHFYMKGGRWKAALQFTPKPIQRYSMDLSYGCIGIDLNPGSIDWAYVDWDGNLKHHGKFVLQQGLPQGKMKAQLVRVSLLLAELAIKYKCPVVCEELDFTRKKSQLKEVSHKLARMLSGWAYSEFFKQLSSILANRGIQLKTVNPAYTSLIGLVKYVRQYGISNGVAAAISIARRGMYLKEKIPSSIKAKLSVKDGMHSWSYWNKLNQKIKTCTAIRNRHSYYSISNWGFLVKEQ